MCKNELKIELVFIQSKMNIIQTLELALLAQVPNHYLSLFHACIVIFSEQALLVCSLYFKV